MFAVLVLSLVTAAPQRTARLLTAQEIAALEVNHARVAELTALAPSGVRTVSIVALAITAGVPAVYLGGFALFAAIAGGLNAASGYSFAATFNPAMEAAFNIIPPVVWVAVLVAVVVSTAVLVGTYIADAPRMKELKALKQEERRILKGARRGTQPQEPQLSAPPMVTLATF